MDSFWHQFIGPEPAMVFNPEKKDPMVVALVALRPRPGRWFHDANGLSEIREDAVSIAFP